MRRIAVTALAVGLALAGCDGPGLVTPEDVRKARSAGTAASPGFAAKSVATDASADRTGASAPTTGAATASTAASADSRMVAAAGGGTGDAMAAGSGNSAPGGGAPAGGATARGAAAAGGQAEALHALVMEAVPYLTLNEPKAMVACLRAEPQTETWRAHQVFTTYTARTSDGPIFLTQLTNDALHRCREWGRAEDIDCTCLPLDKNGKNVLALP